MAQKTSELWQELKRRRNTRREYKFEIDGEEYGEDSLVSQNVTGALFDKFGTGNAVCAKLTLTIYADSVPRGATIKRFVRLVEGTDVSEWLPAGIYFVNRRAADEDLWTLEAFDGMRKAERRWVPYQSLEFPMPMPKAVEILAELMGCEIDERTVINPAYAIDYPSSDPDSEEGDFYTIRQILQWIATAHGGNWIMTGEGKLRLLPLGEEPEETSLLVTEHGEPIDFGGCVILV